MTETMGFVTVARVGEIAVGAMKLTRMDDTTIAVFHLDDGYWAIEDVCTHDGGPVAEGTLAGSIIECPRHGATFDVRSGAALTFPATQPVPTYPVRVMGDEIQVSMDPAAAAAAPVNPHTGLRQPWEVPSDAPSAPIPSAPTAAGNPSAAPEGAPPAQKQSGPPAFSSMPTQQEMAVRAALESVIDPEINLSVIDLGLIREIHFLPQKTFVRMMLTTPFCPYAPQMIADVKAASESAVPQPCEVELMADPWSPEMMPDPSLLGFSY